MSRTPSNSLILGCSLSLPRAAGYLPEWLLDMLDICRLMHANRESVFRWRLFHMNRLACTIKSASVAACFMAFLGTQWPASRLCLGRFKGLNLAPLLNTTSASRRGRNWNISGCLSLEAVLPNVVVASCLLGPDGIRMGDDLERTNRTTLPFYRRGRVS